MNLIVGSSVPLCISHRLYLVGYISIAEWEIFTLLLERKCEKEALFFLIYSSLYRGDCSITKKRVKRLFRYHSSIIISLIDTICKISMPEVKIKDDAESLSKKELERNTKIMYRMLSRIHGWTPRQISDMSPAQIYLYLMGGSTGAGTEKMTGMEYQALLASRGGLN